MKLRFAIPLVALSATMLSACSTACWAQFAGGDGISVFGLGEVHGRPNVVEMDFQVSGKAELTGDALVKHRDAKNRLLEAIEKVKTDSVSVDERGVQIGVGNLVEQQQRVINGQVQAPAKPQMEVASTVRIRLKGIRDVPPEELVKTIGKLMDTAQDAGVNVGPTQADLMRAARFGQQLSNSSPVRFVIADVNQLREKAYEKAVADARLRAQRLAKLHQVKLGPATLIQELAAPGDQAQGIVYGGPNQPLPAEYEGEEPRMVCGTLAGVSVQVKLQVRFGIERTAEATAQK